MLVLLLVLAPIAVLAAFQGMVTAGLLPLAIFGPFYAIGRALLPTGEVARREGARVLLVASLGGAFALLPALVFLRSGTGAATMGEHVTAGLFALGAGLGGLLALATSPTTPERPRPEQVRQWTLVEALTPEHGRALTGLFAAALPAAVLVAALREAALFGGPTGASLPEALLGAHTAQGFLLIPGPDWPVLLAIPLSLAPLALGFLTSPRQSLPILYGGVAMLVLTPVVILLDFPVVTVEGTVHPLSLSTVPALDATVVLAPAGAGLLLGAGLAALSAERAALPPAGKLVWLLPGVFLGAALYGWLPGLALAGAVLAAGALLQLQGAFAHQGVALLSGVVLGGLASLAGTGVQAALVGVVVGAVGMAAVTARGALTTVTFPPGATRSPRTLAALLVGAVVGGGLLYLAARPIGEATAPFQAPHARVLAAALTALTGGQGLWILFWGFLAGLVLQRLTGRIALVAVGFLAGPGIALLVVLGSLARSWWEHHLLEQAKQGWFLQGEVGFRLLRVHALVVAVLAGEAIALSLVGWVGG